MVAREPTAVVRSLVCVLQVAPWYGRTTEWRNTQAARPRIQHVLPTARVERARTTAKAVQEKVNKARAEAKPTSERIPNGRTLGRARTPSASLSTPEAAECLCGNLLATVAIYLGLPKTQ